ncbi:poly-beta-1,6-N-acetyl-D-glucosamine biosynthesis protein PgaD [Verrucomicrobiota bacterium]
MKNSEQYIIDEPGLKSTLRSGTELSITLIAWIVWIYLVIPVVTLFLWIVGVRLVIIEQAMLKGAEGLISVLGYYIAGGVLIWLVLQIWSFYNKKRFAGHDRRHQALPVSKEELIKYFNVSEEEFIQANNSKLVTVEFDAGKITLKNDPPTSLREVLRAGE